MCDYRVFGLELAIYPRMAQIVGLFAASNRELPHIALNPKP